MRLLNFIFLHRNWEVDKLKFGRRLQRLVFGQMPFSLVIFPEGTTLCDNTIAKSVKFAKDNDLPVPSHTLLPRVTGMQFALTTLGQNIGGVFDLTIGYTGTTPLEHPEDTFGLKSLFFNGIAPPLIHVHVKYHPISTIPYNDQSAFQDWLYTVYREKDRLMAEFYQNGCFRGIKSRRISVAPNSAMLLIAISTAVATVMLWSLVAAILFWVRFK
jgi:1-acyl-sn-glycerol-3-phosphate acyltransferase